MAGQGIRMLFEPQRSLSFGSIGSAYMGVGSAVNNPMRQFIIQNLTDATLQFSYDGINDHFPLPAGALFVDDVTSNATAISSGFFIAEGTRLYVKEIETPTTGSVYFSAVYSKEF